MNKRITVIIVIAFAIVLALYLIVFRYGLSHSTTTWSEFGGYVSGILMPILTAINIFVFVKLTNAISEEDSKRSEKELSFQRQLMLMQFRKAEIDAFEKTMENVLSFKENTDYKNVKQFLNDTSFSVLNAMIYLDSFMNTKLEMFNLNKKSKAVTDIASLISLLDNYNNNLNEGKIVEKEEYLKMFNLKNSIIYSLQKVILYGENK